MPYTEKNNLFGARLYWPDKMAFSKDGSYLAVTNTKANLCSINLYRTDPQTNLIQPVPVQVIRHDHTIFHGVQFSPDSRYLVSTTMDSSGLILVYKLDYGADGSLDATLSQIVQTRYSPLKPKSVGFSGDGSLIAICYGPNAAESHQNNGALAVHAFDNETGTISTLPLCERCGTPELLYPDDVAFFHDDLSTVIVVPSQAIDRVVFYSFDKMTNEIDPQSFAFANPEAQLSFPHGIALSSDDNYLAVSNYGDDKVTVYSLKMEGHSGR